MRKVFYLASVLKKCTGAASKDDQQVSDKAKDLIIYIVFAFIFVGMYFVGRILPTWSIVLGDPYSVFQSVFMMGAVVALFLIIPGMLNTLYMSSDMGMLLTLPFTSNQIVFARVINLLRLPVLISLVVTLAPGIGYITVEGAEAGFVLAIILAFICLPVIVISAVGIIVIVLMRFIKGLRSRDSLRIIGAVVLIIAVAAYIIITNSDFGKDAVSQISQTVSKFSFIFPINFALAELMKDISVPAILETLAIAAAFLIVFILAAMKLYLAGALSMQDTSSSGGVLTDKAFAKEIKKESVVKTYVKKEIKMTGKNPTYLLTGYLYPIFMPIIIVVALLFTGSNALDMSEMSPAVKTYYLFTMMVPIMTAIGAGLCAVATTPISREGEDFMILRLQPVKFSDIIRAKKIAGLIVGIGPTLFYIIVGGSILTGIYGMQFWGVLYGLVVAAALGITGVNITMTHDLKKPNLVWDNEAQMVKSSTGIVSIIYFAVCFVIGLAFAFIALIFELPTVAAVVIVLAICIVSAVVTGMQTRKWTAKVAKQLKM